MNKFVDFTKSNESTDVQSTKIKDGPDGRTEFSYRRRVIVESSRDQTTLLIYTTQTGCWLGDAKSSLTQDHVICPECLNLKLCHLLAGLHQQSIRDTLPSLTLSLIRSRHTETNIQFDRFVIGEMDRYLTSHWY
jgi:hypothetical protein